MPSTFRTFLAAFALLLVAATGAFSQSLTPDFLRCEYRVNPLGIDVARPRLSWELKASDPSARNLSESAWRVIVASSAAKLAADEADLWDSGKVAGSQSIHVEYAGKPLASNAEAHWKVQVWDQDGTASPWSAPARWSTGLLNAYEWKAAWIGKNVAANYQDPESPFHDLRGAQWIWHAGETPQGKQSEQWFRLTVRTASPATLRMARLLMGADHSFEVFVNGARIGMGTNTTIRMPQLFDLRPYLKVGANEILARVEFNGNGVPRGLLAALRLEESKDRTRVEKSGTNWQTAASKTGPWSAAVVVAPYGMAPLGDVGFDEERMLPARYLRKEFALRPAIRRATAYISGLGLSELYLNGKKVGDHVLSPNLTEYDRRVFYVTHDITSFLNAGGANAVGVILGNGRFWAPRTAVPIETRTYSAPMLRLQMEIEYADGSQETVVSDSTWKLSTQGAIRGNNEYDGEIYDARLEFANWASPGFDDTKWESARNVTGPAGAMVAQMAEPLRVMETLSAKKLSEPKPGVWVFDLGQNMVGWTRLRVSGPRGATVTIRHAETLNPDGMLYVDNLRSARATSIYTLKGEGTEIWEPRFTYYGFRYVEVTGFPGKPTLQTIEGRVVHDALPKAGEWTSSNSLLNQIYSNMHWGIRGNYRSIPTDCPQRDERQGWLGDRSMGSRSESYMFDVAAFYEKWITDIADSQHPNGSVPVVAPAYWPIYNDDVTWPSTLVLSANMLYEQYADTRAIERNYPALRQWINHMLSYEKDGLMPRDTYGDWCVPPEDPKLILSKDPARLTDGTLLGTAYFYEMLRLMERHAGLLGKPGDQRFFEEKADAMRVAFHKKWFNPETGLYANGTQTSSLLPLAFGIPPEEQRGALFSHLIGRIEKESNWHVGTGLIGTQWLMRTLSDNGRPDVAYRIATQTDYPGWGYMVSKGATTIWELWNGDTAAPEMNSGNHVMLIGDLNLWLYEYLAGIRSDPNQPGFKRVLLEPYAIDGLSHVKASHRGMYGEIRSEWQRDGSTLTFNVTIPPNSTARVAVPAPGSATVKETGSGPEALGVKYLGKRDGRALFDVGSGSYTFVADGK